MQAKRARTESLNNQIYNVLIDNLVISLYVLHEHFGFGAKRSDQYVKALVEMVDRFDEEARDGVHRVKTEDVRREYQETFHNILRVRTKEFMPPDFYAEVFEARRPTRSDVKRKYDRETRERAEKTAVSVAQAAEMQKAAQIFQQFLRDNEKGG